ncbi:MAG: glycosyltransferase [Muribaculaceae bacterium]|nr:glycosyltransferase [Muribaculaceae bacterium]
MSLKVLLLGDYSNCHRTLATGLRRLGCEVTQASDGSSWMGVDRQIDIRRKPGRLNGLMYFMRWLAGDLRQLAKGYDVVAIHDLNFIHLRPERLRPLLRRIKRENGSLFLTAMSTDKAYLDMVAPPSSPLRYSEWFIGNEKSPYNLGNPGGWEQWHSPELQKYHSEALAMLDGAVSVLYEYHLGIERALGKEKVAYGGIPIDTSLFEPVELKPKTPVKLFLGRDRYRKLMKGSDLLEQAALRVKGAELDIVENLPFNEFVGRLRSADIVLDQIYSYTPATTALMAMAYGLPTVSGGEPEFYDFIGETDNRPIINAPIELEALTATLQQAVDSPEALIERGRQSREFVIKHNDCEVVAKRFLDFWTSRL